MQLIYEQAVDTKIEIIEESFIPGTNSGKMIFKAILQVANVANNNKRMYPTETLIVVLEQLRQKALDRKLLGELDHPQPGGDDASKVKRASTILLQNTCIVYRELEFIDNKIIAECETLNNRFGRDLYNILKDNISIGFSLRAFGSVRKTPAGFFAKISAVLTSAPF